MSQPQLYRLCLKSGNFFGPTCFKISVGKQQKKVNPYFIASDRQRYNYDSILQRNHDQKQVRISCDQAGHLVGTGKLVFDHQLLIMPNEKVEIYSGDGICVGTIQCSLAKIDKVVQVPALRIQVDSGNFQSGVVGNLYLVMKYGDLNYQTNPQSFDGHLVVWKQSFDCPASQMERILVQAWFEDKESQEFLGVAIVSLKNGLKADGEYDVLLANTKKGTIRIFMQEQKLQKPKSSSLALKRTVKVTVVEAVMHQITCQGAFINLHVGGNQFATTPIYTEQSQLRWNQYFHLQINSEQEELVARLCIRSEIEEEIGRGSLQVSSVSNRRYELALTDGGEKVVGKLYLEFYDQELNISEEIPRKRIGKDKVAKISSAMAEIRKRYGQKESIHEYMSKVQSAVQEGLVELAKNRSCNPLKRLGEFLLSYDRNGRSTGSQLESVKS